MPQLGVFDRHIDDITETMWGSKEFFSCISELKRIGVIVLYRVGSVRNIRERNLPDS